MKLPLQALRFSLLAALLGAALPASAAVPSPNLPPVDHYVYLSFLPKPSELTQDAKASGLTILRIDELADRVIVSYQYADGHTATLGYALLGSKPSGISHPAATAVQTTTAQSSARYVVTDRDPEVIYVAPPSTTRVYYYSDPWYSYWAPVTVGFGLGWATAYYGGHYYYHGGGHYHGGGGHHGGGHGHH